MPVIIDIPDESGFFFKFALELGIHISYKLNPPANVLKRVNTLYLKSRHYVVQLEVT